MIKFIFSLLTISLIAQSTSSTVALAAVTPYTAVYPIDPSQRGADIISMVTALYQLPTNGIPDVVIQTTLPQNFTNSTNGTKGLIPFVQKFNPTFATPYNTLLIVTFSTTLTATISTNQYFVVPVEQISEVIYSTSTISNTSVFTSTISTGVLPYYSVNMAQRAADIQSVVQTLNSNPIFTNSGNQKVSIQTTLNGTFYAPVGSAPPITNGLIQLVQSVSLTGSPQRTLMIIAYGLSNNTANLTYVVVSPEQVTGIFYSRS